MIISLDDAYAAVNVTQPSGDDDAEMLSLILGVTVVVEGIVGPVSPRSVTDWLNGGTSQVVLKSWPVVSVESVTEYNPTPVSLVGEPFGTDPFTDSGYRVNLQTGVLTRTSGGSPRTFAAGQANIKVTYTAGQASIPNNITQAAQELVRINWQPQQSGNFPGITTEDADFQGERVNGYFIPNRVMELLRPSQLPPVIA